MSAFHTEVRNQNPPEAEQVLHCRTNEQVFGALCAAGAFFFSEAYDLKHSFRSASESPPESLNPIRSYQVLENVSRVAGFAASFGFEVGRDRVRRVFGASQFFPRPSEPSTLHSDPLSLRE